MKDTAITLVICGGLILAICLFGPAALLVGAVGLSLALFLVVAAIYLHQKTEKSR